MKKNLRAGHRKRMIEKFLHNQDNFSTTDLIEMILFLSIPLKDTKDIAINIKKEFKYLSKFLSAEPEVLKKINGLGEQSIFVVKLLFKLIKQILSEKIENSDVIKNFDDLIKYFQFSIGEKTHEECVVLFLNSKNRVIKEESISKGSVNQVIIFPREVLKRCIEIPCSSIILIHNHPSQEPTPSRDDIEMTRQVINLVKHIGVTVHDHIIVGIRDYFSFKQNGLI